MFSFVDNLHLVAHGSCRLNQQITVINPNKCLLSCL